MLQRDAVVGRQTQVGTRAGHQNTAVQYLSIVWHALGARTCQLPRLGVTPVRTCLPQLQVASGHPMCRPRVIVRLRQPGQTTLERVLQGIPSSCDARLNIRQNYLENKL